MRGLIIVITDCLTPLSELEAPLTALATSGHDVTLFQTLDPTEIHFDFKDAVNFEDIESGTVLPTDPESARAGYLKKFNAHQSAKLVAPSFSAHFVNKPCHFSLHYF